MVKVLINGATILTLSMIHDPVIEKGYVYIKDGKIVEVGKGEPPEDLRYPELLINGTGRIVMPGLSTAFTTITFYPFRYRVTDINWEYIKEFMSTLTRTDVYYLAAMAFMEMMTRGITSAFVTDIYLDNVARAAHDAGIYVTLAPPMNAGLDDFNPENEIRLLMSRWHGKVSEVRAALLTYGGMTEEFIELLSKYKLRGYILKSRIVEEKTGNMNLVYINPKGNASSTHNVVRYGEELSRWKENEGLGIGVRPAYSMVDVVRDTSLRAGASEIDVLHTAVATNNKLIGHALGPIEVGATANIVMLDTSSPPGWPPPKRIDDIVRAITYGDLRVETVIAGDNILVDAGEPLTLGSEVVMKARNRFDEKVTTYMSSKKR